MNELIHCLLLNSFGKFLGRFYIYSVKKLKKMSKNVTALEQFIAFKGNNIMDSDGEINTRCNNFYDWFCNESSLRNKAKQLFPKAIKLAKLLNIDTSKTYVWFKNNCPINGSLYDDIRFSDIESGNNQWVLIPKSGHNDKCELWGSINNFDGPYMEANNWREMINKLKEIQHETV